MTESPIHVGNRQRGVGKEKMTLFPTFPDRVKAMQCQLQFEFGAAWRFQDAKLANRIRIEYEYCRKNRIEYEYCRKNRIECE